MASATLVAQKTGQIQGTIADPQGVGVPRIAMQAVNTSSKAVFEAFSAGGGAFAIGGLPAGTYDVRTARVDFLQAWEKKGVSVGAGETVQLNARLDYRLLSNAPGEGWESYLNSLRRVAPKGAAPRTREGKPDLSGVWSMQVQTAHTDPEFLPGKAAPFTGLRPSTFCLPHSIVWPYAYFKLVQTPALLVMLIDDEEPSYRQMFLDGRHHPEDPNPSWYGHSIGHWEGDSLVVDRVGFNDRVWLDAEGHRHSGKLHVTERYRRPDLGHLEIQTTFEDPDFLKVPFSITTMSILAPEEEIQEYACNENNIDPQHAR